MPSLSNPRSSRFSKSPKKSQKISAAKRPIQLDYGLEFDGFQTFFIWRARRDSNPRHPHFFLFLQRNRSEAPYTPFQTLSLETRLDHVLISDILFFLVIYLVLLILSYYFSSFRLLYCFISLYHFRFSYSQIKCYLRN